MRHRHHIHTAATASTHSIDSNKEVADVDLRQFNDVTVFVTHLKSGPGRLQSFWRWRGHDVVVQNETV